MLGDSPLDLDRERTVRNSALQTAQVMAALHSAEICHGGESKGGAKLRSLMNHTKPFDSSRLHAR